MKKIIIMVITIALVILFTVTGNAQVPETTYQWTPPTIGTPVVEYVVELNTDDAGWVQIGRTPDTTFTFNDFEFGKLYEVRVAGVDSLDRQGPFSVSSDPYVPDMGLPGQPSKPVILQL